MASQIRLDFEAADHLLSYATLYGKANQKLASEMAAALVLAGITLLSTGMDDEQVRAVLDQSFEMTAPLRAERNRRPPIVRS